MNYFKKIDADLAIVVAYGQIIPKEFLNLPKKDLLIFMLQYYLIGEVQLQFKGQ